ncbi:MAG: nitroreductase family protein [Prevotellaceae bacterium]|nr:nitroreductase family protein [Prevotellaceae bacterium]
MDFKDLVQKRRSIRKFTDEELTAEQVQLILRAALMSPTSKSTRAWHFIVVDNKDTLEKLSQCKSAGAEFVKDAAMAVVVLMDTTETDVWVEDASIAAVTMQYQAADLGLGSCWAQVRLRCMEDGTPANDILRFILGYPETWEADSIIAFGHPALERKPQDEDKLKWENVSIDNK